MSEREIDFQEMTGKEWLGCKIDLSRPIEPPEPLLIQSETGIPLLYRRGIHVSSGKQKAGKTFYNSILMAALLNPDGFCGFRPTKTIFKILFADTEQDRSDTQEVMKRIHRINGWKTDQNSPNLIGMNLREFSAEQRIKLIKEALMNVDPDILVIDGIVDLCVDFNSLEESHALTTMLLGWAVEHDVSIITALHINKGNDELRGHLGAFLAQKGESVMRVSKENDGITYMDCKIVDARHKPIDDFAFRIVEGLPEPYEPLGTNKPSVNYENLFQDILKQPLRYNNLVEAVAKSTGKADSTARRYIDAATKLGIIQNKKGFYEYKNTLPF